MPAPRLQFRATAGDTAASLARELVAARAVAGLTQRQVAKRAGVSQAFISQVERGRKMPSISVLHRLTSAMGHDLSVRFFPGGGIRLRDSGQMRVAEAIRAALAPTWRVRLEVPVGAPPDRRAADMVLDAPAEVVQIEIETALADFQAQLRAGQLKRTALATQMRRAVRLVIALPDTRRTRAVVADHLHVVRAALPAPSRRIWSALRSGAEVGGDGLLWVARSGARPPR
jgi:transcriptional regulator with XRE-family HTH domain